MPAIAWFIFPSVLLVVALIGLAVGYRWGLRERELRTDDPVPPRGDVPVPPRGPVLSRRQPGRHARGYRLPAPEGSDEPGQLSAKPHQPVPLPVLARVHQALKDSLQDDEEALPTAPAPRALPSPDESPFFAGEPGGAAPVRAAIARGAETAPFRIEPYREPSPTPEATEIMAAVRAEDE